MNKPSLPSWVTPFLGYIRLMVVLNSTQKALHTDPRLTDKESEARLALKSV